MKKIAGILTLCAVTTVQAQTEWIDIASNNENMKWAVQAGSLDFSKTRGGVAIAVMIGRIIDPRTSNIILYKWYVSASDCQRKMGKVVTLDISGEYQYENDFVMGSGNIASSMAETICGVADYIISEKNKKGL